MNCCCSCCYYCHHLKWMYLCCDAAAWLCRSCGHYCCVAVCGLHQNQNWTRWNPMTLMMKRSLCGVTVSCFLSNKEKVELDINFTIEMNCMQINGGKDSSVAGNWNMQWTTTDLVWCHPPWPGSCQNWYIYIYIYIYIYMCVLLLLNQLHTLTSETETVRERETAQSLKLKHILSYRSGLFCIS